MYEGLGEDGRMVEEGRGGASCQWNGKVRCRCESVEMTGKERRDCLCSWLMLEAVPIYWCLEFGNMVHDSTFRNRWLASDLKRSRTALYE